MLHEEDIREGFARQDIDVFSDKDWLNKRLEEQAYENADVLLMSSGDYDG